MRREARTENQTQFATARRSGAIRTAPGFIRRACGFFLPIMKTKTKTVGGIVGTPGPWTFDETWMLVKGPQGEEICAIHSGQGDGQRVDRNIAWENAHILTAARDLLQACHSALERLSFADPDNQPASKPALFIDQSTYKQIRAAINKATA